MKFVFKIGKGGMVMADNGWQNAQAAEKYLQTADIVAPGRRDILDIIARLAIYRADNDACFLDLGCGAGDVTAEIIKLRSDTRVTMIDFSASMVDISKKRFSAYPEIQYVKHDLNQGLPVLGEIKYDAIVSCFALHHVIPDRKIALYEQIRQHLKPNGIFINGDLFKGFSPVIDQWEFNNYIKWMVPRLEEAWGEKYSFDEIKTRQLENYRVMGDMPGTLWDSYRDLQEAGFRYVDCLYKNQNLAVICAAED